MSEAHYVLAGKIVGVHGIKGMVKIFSYCESDALFSPDAVIFSKDPDGNFIRHKIVSSSRYKRILRVLLEGISNRDDAASFVNLDIYVQKSDLEKPESGAYFWFDLIGMAVMDENSLCLGHVASIFHTGSNDVLVVTNAQNNEILIPAIASVVREVDVPNRMMHVVIPEGLTA